MEQIHLTQTNVGVLGGGAFDFGENVHLDFGAGYFQQGKFDLPDVAGQAVYTYGGSARLVFHDKDMPLPLVDRPLCSTATTPTSPRSSSSPRCTPRARRPGW